MDDYVTDSRPSNRSKQVPGESSFPDIGPARSLNIITEENIRMRQAINDMTLRLMTWMHRNSEQATQVEQLLQALRKSDDKQKELTRELQEAKNQLKACQSSMVMERTERIKADRERDQARNLILRLQEENWELRRSREPMLICRGPGGSSSRPNVTFHPS